MGHERGLEGDETVTTLPFTWATSEPANVCPKMTRNLHNTPLEDATDVLEWSAEGTLSRATFLEDRHNDPDIPWEIPGYGNWLASLEGEQCLREHATLDCNRRGDAAYELNRWSGPCCGVTVDPEEVSCLSAGPRVGHSQLHLASLLQNLLHPKSSTGSAAVRMALVNIDLRWRRMARQLLHQAQALVLACRDARYNTALMGLAHCQAQVRNLLALFQREITQRVKVQAFLALSRPPVSPLAPPRL